MIKHWSSTRTSVALSSGEAEFAGVIRGAGQGLGYQALLRDFGVEARLRVWTDSSAAIGICSRQGLGKLRHLDTHTLWIQQAVRTKRIDLRKVLGEENPADLLTKHSLSRERLEKLIDLFGCRYMGGRADSAPLMRRGTSSKATMASSGANVDAVEIDSEEKEEQVDPMMPHLMFEKEELDERYPIITAPIEEELYDFNSDEHDAVFQTGLKIAEQIKSETKTHGRTRKNMSPNEQEDAKVTNSAESLSRVKRRLRVGHPVAGGVTRSPTLSTTSAPEKANRHGPRSPVKVRPPFPRTS